MDTIVALATVPGSAGISVIRLSGPLSYSIALNMSKSADLKPNQAFVKNLYVDNEKIDESIVIYFKAPRSYTGEDVVEFQCHGSMAVVNKVINACLQKGARMSGPGEYTQRAYLNGKIDLIQAEAVSDLILSDNEFAAKAALDNLSGKFSRCVNAIEAKLINIRMEVEAAIDFADEDLELSNINQINKAIAELLVQLKELINNSKSMDKLHQGIKVVIAGKPNAGKSTLINALSAEDVAIVTDIPGTTRDIIKKDIHIDGVKITLMDTAGIRETSDKVEAMGVSLSNKAMQTCHQVLWLCPFEDLKTLEIPKTSAKILVVVTKIDKHNDISPKAFERDNLAYIYLSAKSHRGIDLLIEHIKSQYVLNEISAANFMVKARHLSALKNTVSYLDTGVGLSLDLVAENLKLAHESLQSLTGKFTSDDLLGEIFSNFCIGK